MLSLHQKRDKMAKNRTNNPSFLKRFFSPGVQKRSAETSAASRSRILPDFGVTIDNGNALKNTALYAGIRIISENIASLPKTILEQSSKGAVPYTQHNAYRLINVRPNPYTNVFSFWSTIVTWIKGWGNAYAIIERENGRPVALHQVHPSCVRQTVIKGHRWFVITISGDFAYLSGTYPDEDVLHFFELSLDGLKGVNPILYNAAALGKSLATESFAADFYRQGGNIRAVLEYDNELGDEAFENFMKHYKDSSQNFGTPFLEYGIKYKQTPIDPIASQLIQSEILSIQDVCRIINIPPHMVAELSHATFSNIEHQTIQFVQYSLRPIVKRLETELEAKLFTEREQGIYDVKFILDGLLRGDTAARSAYYHNAILDGYLSRNEVRALEGYEHRDGLDAFLTPANENVVGEKNEE